MANRIMQAKAMKFQRQLRLLPRPNNADVPGKFVKHSGTAIPARLRAEGMVTPRQPNRELMQGYKDRAASLGCPDWKGKFNGQWPGRQLEAYLEHIAVVMPEFKTFTIKHTQTHKVQVCYNPTKTCFMLLYENYEEHTVRTSITYSDKMRLIDTYRANRLRWVELRSSSQTREGG